MIFKQKVLKEEKIKFGIVIACVTIMYVFISIISLIKNYEVKGIDWGIIRNGHINCHTKPISGSFVIAPKIIIDAPCKSFNSSITENPYPIFLCFFKCYC